MLTQLKKTATKVRLILFCVDFLDATPTKVGPSHTIRAVLKPVKLFMHDIGRAVLPFTIKEWRTWSYMDRLYKIITVVLYTLVTFKNQLTRLHGFYS